jgi:NDP-sugar pyrophosphorylase family protein
MTDTPTEQSESPRATLVVMAAGAGSRFGGAKQLTPIGPHGEWLLEYALFDARRAGFGRAVLIVQEGLESEFRSRLARVRSIIDVKFVTQRLDDLPDGAHPGSRERPWGTGQAVLAARHVVEAPFAIVNADDFYGAAAYREAVRAAHRAQEDGSATVVAMRLNDTLSEHGPVKRAWCHAEAGRVTSIEEVMGIERRGGQLRGTASRGEVSFDGSELVSMNFWVFPPKVFEHLDAEFTTFLRQHRRDELSEFLLPDVIGRLVADARLQLEVVETPGPWFGVTFRQDREAVAAGLRELAKRGEYPTPLWADHDS